MSQSSPSQPRLSEIITVIIRLQAINVLLVTIPYVGKVYSSFNGRSTSSVPDLLIIAASIVAVCWLWRYSAPLARFITRGQDSTIAIGSFTSSDLYTFAFVLVGTYLVAVSFGPVLVRLRQALMESGAAAQHDYSREWQAQILEYLFKDAVQFTIGLALTFNGRNFANKLIRYHRKHMNDSKAAAEEAESRPITDASQLTASQPLDEPASAGTDSEPKPIIGKNVLIAIAIGLLIFILIMIKQTGH